MSREVLFSWVDRTRGRYKSLICLILCCIVILQGRTFVFHVSVCVYLFFEVIVPSFYRKLFLSTNLLNVLRTDFQKVSVKVRLRYISFTSGNNQFFLVTFEVVTIHFNSYTASEVSVVRCERRGGLRLFDDRDLKVGTLQEPQCFEDCALVPSDFFLQRGIGYILDGILKYSECLGYVPLSFPTTRHPSNHARAPP